MSMIYCPKCGKQISDKAAFCVGCGASVPEMLGGQTVGADAQPAASSAAPAAAPASAPNKSNKILIIIIVILAVLLVGVGSVLGVIAVFSISGSSGPSGQASQSSYDDVNQLFNFEQSSNQTFEQSSAYTRPETSYESSKTVSEPPKPTSYSVNLNVYVEHNINMGKYNVDVLVDGMVLATLGDKQSYNQTLTLSPGKHVIAFQENGNPSNVTECSETIKGDTTLSYSLKRRSQYDLVHGYGIDVTRS